MADECRRSETGEWKAVFTLSQNELDGPETQKDTEEATLTVNFTLTENPVEFTEED